MRDHIKEPMPRTAAAVLAEPNRFLTTSTQTVSGMWLCLLLCNVCPAVNALHKHSAASTAAALWVAGISWLQNRRKLRFRRLAVMVDQGEVVRQTGLYMGLEIVRDMPCNQYSILPLAALVKTCVRWPNALLTWASLHSSLCAQVRMVRGQVLGMVTATANNDQTDIRPSQVEL